MDYKMSKKWYVIIIVVAVILAGVGSWLFMLQSTPSNVTNLKEFESIEELLNVSQEVVKIEALSKGSAGVDINSDFKIYSDKIDLALDKSSVRVTPEHAFSLNKESKNVYSLKFEEPLKANIIYKIAVEDKNKGISTSKAFQTSKEFRVLRTLPRDKSTYVPINTGIEITFTHTDMNNIKDYFEITPAVKGSFEIHKETAVYVPEKLDYDTVYTVKIKKGLPIKNSSEALKEEYIFQFQTERQENAVKNEGYFNFSNRMYNYTSKEVPVLNVYADKYYRDKELDIKLYSYRDAEAFLNDLRKNDDRPAWTVKNRESIIYDKSVLQEAMSFKEKIYEAGSPWYQDVIVFPAQVEEGYYLVSMSYGDKEFTTHMQVNDISAYIMLGGEKSLVWVNDTRTGEPLKGVEIKGEGIKSDRSNEKGIAEFELIKGENTYQHYISLIAQNRLPFVSYLEESYYSYMYADSDNTAEKYWSYLYLDRGMYLPTDTIQVWGVAKPRAEGRLEELTVQVEKYAYFRYDESTSDILVSKDVKVSPYGTYTCSLEYEHFNPGSYFISVRSGEEVISRKYFQIKKYTKPAYKMEIKADKKALFLGDTLNLDIQASFFEGSPVSGLKINYSQYSWNDKIKYVEGNLKCDVNGQAEVKIRPEYTKSEANWYPQYISYRFNNATAEEEEVYAYASVDFFPRDIMIYGEGKVNADGFMADIKTNKIVLDRLNSEEEVYSYDMENYKGDTIDIPLKGKLIEKRWDRREIGQYYDYINKVTQKRYEYYTVETILDEFEINTVNGKAVYQFPYANHSRQRSYYIELSGNDQKNRLITETMYLQESYLEYMEIGERYSFREMNNKYQFKIGESTNLSLIRNGETFDAGEKGKTLYMLLKDGLQEADIVADSKLTFEFAKEYIPNSYIKMVYFDGERVHDVGIYGFNYDYTEKELDIKITPDKSYYRPGDKVKLDIEVKDKNGNPCEAEVNISAVDEAFFAIWDQYVYTLSDIYSYVFGTGIQSEYYSYKNNQQFNGGAECGEGGDEGEPRYDFKDNAFFGTVKTNSSGKGTIEFSVPDNLTSWRITYQAVTEDLKAGNGRENINVKLPFFISLIFNDVYLAQDEPGISIRAFGTEVKQGAEIKYRVVLEGPDGLQKEYDLKGTAGSFSNLVLESLIPGSYSISVYAESGNLKDAIKKDFKVVESILETARTDYFDLNNDTDIPSLVDISDENAMAELVFYNKEISDYYRTLNTLYYSWGQRVDQVLSRKIAGEYLKKYFDNEYVYTDNEDISIYQIYDGGIALFSYDSSSPVLSAKVCSAAKEIFDRVDLKSYFYSRIDDERTPSLDVAACYWGLAALGEPVLTDIYRFLDDKEIGWKEKLYYGIALAELGDIESAGNIYREIIKQYGQYVKPYVYLNMGEDRDVNIEMTALCAIIGIKGNILGHDELFRYTMNNSTDDILTNLERLIYLTSKTPDTKQESSFTYSAAGKSEKVAIKGLERYRLVLTGDAFKELQFNNVRGDIELALNYIGPVKDLAEAEQGHANIKRRYLINGKESSVFNQSDIITIEMQLEFSPNAPEGYYQVTDVLPSGLKYVQPNWGRQADYSWGNVNGQKITFGYYYDHNDKRPKTILYLARVIAPGKYMADNGIILHAKSRVCGFTAQNVITIVSSEQ